MIHLFDWFTSHPSLSKKAFSENLRHLHSYILPPGNRLPSSYYEAYKILKHHLIEEVIYDVCPDDCIIFRNEFSLLRRCPKCNSERYKKSSVGKDIPHRTFVYLPIKPRLERNFASSKISEMLQSHKGNDKSCVCDFIKDIHDSTAWKEAYDQNGVFHGDDVELHYRCAWMD